MDCWFNYENVNVHDDNVTINTFVVVSVCTKTGTLMDGQTLILLPQKHP